MSSPPRQFRGTGLNEFYSSTPDLDEFYSSIPIDTWASRSSAPNCIITMASGQQMRIGRRQWKTPSLTWRDTLNQGLPCWTWAAAGVDRPVC